MRNVWKYIFIKKKNEGTLCLIYLFIAYQCDNMQPVIAAI